MKKIICPICYSNNAEILLKLKVGNFDQSILYQPIRITACLLCGHIFNNLKDDEIKTLSNYYTEEKRLTNKNSQEKVGYIPGSNNPQNINHYQKVFSFIEDCLKKNSQILDFGFSEGGLTKFLQEKDFKKTTNLDIVDNYLIGIGLKTEPKKSVYGNIFQSLAKESFDLIIMDQVIEHIINPREVFKELKKIIKPGGFLYLGLPDASRYGDNRFFDFYWFLLREHINHFDFFHINQLAMEEGFEIIKKAKNDMPLMSQSMLMPNLNILLRFNGKNKNPEPKNKFLLKSSIQKYLEEEVLRLEARKKFFKNLAKNKTPIYIWGIGREFFYLYEQTDLKKCQIKGLIDKNPYKQKTMTIDKKPIESEGVLKEATNEDFVLATAIGHKQKIKKELSEKKYKPILLDIEL